MHPVMSGPQRILVVDDEANLRDQVSRLVRRAGMEPVTAADGQEALEVLEQQAIDVVLCDVRMPRLDGMALLEKLGGADTDVAVIITSAYGDIELARRALSLGAVDYLPKPIKKHEELALRLNLAQQRLRLKIENQRLRRQVKEQVNLEHIVGESEPIQSLLRTVRKVAEFKSTVLIMGESGTGKELIARAVHDASPRAGGPFVAVNCGAIPENLLESELFGYVRGAFTDAVRNKIGLFEEASGGTLFLDEIGELPLGLQVKLLRVLQEEEVRRVGENRPRNVDVRVLAATIRDLSEEAKKGVFREDLFYRLNVLSLKVPPLRERKEDIPLLANHFLARCNSKLGTRVTSIDPAAMRTLIQYPWPGNVRELENLVERAVILCDSDTITSELLTDKISQTPEVDNEVSFLDPDELSIKKTMAHVERELIRRALAKTGGNRTRAARLLDISHRTLLYKLKDYDIDADQFSD